MLFRIRSLMRLMVWPLVCTAAVFLLAADVKKPVRVTVVKTDKTTLAGELVETTPAGVTVKPLPKGEPTLVPWADIKSVSNGLTHQKIVDDWKSAHAELLCDTCHGDGTTKCDTCQGTGVDPANATPCDKCKGTGDLGKCAKCKEGKVPCPATCIKKTDFRGDKGTDGQPQSRLFKNRDGSGLWFHEGHIGELLVQENGTWVDKGKCPTCGGTTQVICPTCHGTAKRECATCHGAGVTGPACAVCKVGKVGCATCEGTGLKASAKPATP